MGKFIRITPFMHVADVDEAVRFFVEVLGFKAWIHVPDYAYVQRECAGVRIMKASETPGERGRARGRERFGTTSMWRMWMKCMRS